MRQKKCSVCRAPFQPVRPLQSVCSLECAVIAAETAKAKRIRKEHRAAKHKLKSRADWLKEAQAAFNRYIRMRDHDKPCISCGRQHQGQWHAGHYRSVGACPELRFDELNVHKQCAPCNDHLSGNIVEYRRGLIERIGIDRVEWLEGNHAAKKYTIEEIKAIKAEYTHKAKEVRAQTEVAKKCLRVV
jgi:hypothetical protein